MFPWMVRTFGLTKTGSIAGIGQIIAIGVSILGLFMPDSAYNAFEEGSEALFHLFSIGCWIRISAFEMDSLESIAQIAFPTQPNVEIRN